MQRNLLLQMKLLKITSKIKKSRPRKGLKRKKRPKGKLRKQQS